MTVKTDGAFRTIGEVAESLDLPPHVLRFWETRFSEIEPVKRAGGRRYYRPRDVELVAAIRHLLYGRGYTIKGVQRLLREQGVRAVIESARGPAPASSAPSATRISTSASCRRPRSRSSPMAICRFESSGSPRRLICARSRKRKRRASLPHRWSR